MSDRALRVAWLTAWTMTNSQRMEGILAWVPRAYTLNRSGPPRVLA